MIETELDFYLLPHTDRNKFIIIDASEYGEAPESPILSITLPGFRKPISVPFIPRSINIINTSLMGLSQLGDFENFADGVYKFTYSSCPNDQLQKTRYYLIDNILREEYNDKLVAILDGCESSIQTKHAALDDINTFIIGAHIQAERNNPVTAANWYNRARYLLGKFKTTC